MKRGQWITWLAVSTTLARGVAGQIVGGLGPAIVGSSNDQAGWRAASLLSSNLQLDAPLAELVLDDAVARDAAGRVQTSASVISRVASPSFGGFRFAVSAHAHRNQVTPELADDQAFNAALSYTSRMTGAWSGLSTSTWSNPGMVLGIWRDLGSVSLSLTSTIRSGRIGARASSLRTLTRLDSTYTDSTGWVRVTDHWTVGDSGAPAKQRAWAETQGRVSYSIGRFAFDGAVGWRPKLDTIGRAIDFQGFATVQLSRVLALTMGVGTTNTAVPYMRPTGRFATIGLRVAPAFTARPWDPSPAVPSPSAFEVRKTEAGDYLVQVRAPRARVVELSGDFDHWLPLRLSQVQPDVWEATLSLRPGTYHMNIRVDGARWEPPPDVTTVEDDLNGRVGVVVIRD